MPKKVYAHEDEMAAEVAANNYVDNYLAEQKKNSVKLGIDVAIMEKTIKENLIAGEKIVMSEDGTTIEPVLGKEYHNFAKKMPIDMVAEIADNGTTIYQRKKRSELEPEIYLETAEDDRVIGIPHTMTHAGDKVYIINGRVMTGWSMYFSLTAIRSPEDYTQNVDIVYNVPYLYASLNLKAQLGLGAAFDVNYPDDDAEIPEEKFTRRLLFKKLKIDSRKLKKTDFHLSEYGNSYWHLRRDNRNIPDKITILQPERMKIFLDPMTTKILFYIYLPPIIGGTVLTPYPDTKENPNLVHNMALTYPTPIVMSPEDIIHFKQNDYTEYPFGFSDIKSCLDPAQARYDINLLSPIIFKKYAKPMVHWIMNREGVAGKQVGAKLDDMKNQVEDMEPGSDPITTDRWKATVIDAPSGGKNDLLTLTMDLDTQIFAVTGVPETYFKPKGSTDRMIAEQDKTFLGKLAERQGYVGGLIEDRIIIPAIDIEFGKEGNTSKMIDTTVDSPDEKIDNFLRETDSYLAEELRYPEVEWNESFKQDETQEIANTISLLHSGIINEGRAAKRVGEKAPEEFEDPLMDETNMDVEEGREQDLSLLKGGLSTATENSVKGAQSTGAKPMAPTQPPKTATFPEIADNSRTEVIHDGKTKIVITEGE